MNQATRQRILGTVVLLALALIFVPIVFDGEGSYESPVASRTPPVPRLPVLPEPEQSRPVIVADLEAAEAGVDALEAAPEQPTGRDEQDNAQQEQTADDTIPATAEAAQPSAGASPEQLAEAETAPRLDANGLPESWSVRLGVFSDASNAERLLERLQNAGYRAYLRRVDSGAGERSAVYAGPWLERARLEDYRRRLQEEFALEPIIERYEQQNL